MSKKLKTMAMAMAAALSGCGVLASDTAATVTTAAVTAAQVAACSQSAIAEFHALGNTSELAYLSLAARIAECVRESLGKDATPEARQAAVGVGTAVALEVRRGDVTRAQIRGDRAQQECVKTEVAQ